MRPQAKISPVNHPSKADLRGRECCDVAQVELTTLELQLVEQLACGRFAMLVRSALLSFCIADTELAYMLSMLLFQGCPGGGRGRGPEHLDRIFIV